MQLGAGGISLQARGTGAPIAEAVMDTVHICLLITNYSFMKVLFATDHAGFALKEELVAYVKELGHEVIDKGAHELVEDDDYPDYITLASRELSDSPEDSMAIILGGSGYGEAIMANRFKGVRAVSYNCNNLEFVRLCREHNNANTLSLGARFISVDEAKEAVRIFLSTPFSNEERHVRRIQKLDAL